MRKPFYLNCFQYVVIEVREARVLVHHAVYKFGELQQEYFTVGQTIRPQRLDEMHHVWDNLGIRETHLGQTGFTENSRKVL